MELLYSELTKRDVINVSDGRCLGRITDVKLKFPEGKLMGIIVPGRRVRGLFSCFDKTSVFIEERKIIKIGGDVILVDVRCYDGNIDAKPEKPQRRDLCPPPNCPPHGSSTCGHNVKSNSQNGLSVSEFASVFEDGRMDEGDY